VGRLGDEGPAHIHCRAGGEVNTVSERTLTRDTGRVVSDDVEEVSLMAISFKTDIVPLFTSVDIEHMSQLEVPLDDHEYMSQPDNAAGVYHQVSNGTMPPSASGEQPWSEDKVQLFKQWMDGGYAP
jgi:hypothetical protein